jgi:hypothetical protein
MKILYQMMRFIFVNVITPIALWLIISFSPTLIIMLLNSQVSGEEKAQSESWFIGALCIPLSSVTGVFITVIVMLYLKGVFKKSTP